MERRKARRFELGWPVRVTGSDLSGRPFEETSRLENLSSTGAFFLASTQVAVGSKLDVSMKVPFKRENWIEYPAEVIRVESLDQSQGIAIRFSASRPSFFVK